MYLETLWRWFEDYCVSVQNCTDLESGEHPCYRFPLCNNEGIYGNAQLTTPTSLGPHNTVLYSAILFSPSSLNRFDIIMAELSKNWSSW